MDLANSNYSCHPNLWQARRSKISRKQNFLEQMVATDFRQIRFMPFKMACRGWKEVQTSKASEKHHF